MTARPAAQHCIQEPGSPPVTDRDWHGRVRHVDSHRDGENILNDLITIAAALARPFEPGGELTASTVAAAVLTEAGKVYTGICVDARCGVGFCAEHAAVAEMLKARESVVRAVVAVNSRGEVVPPCGRCRELLWQVDVRNRSTWVVLGTDSGKPLVELLPER